MEPISIFRETCQNHGYIYFIEYLPEKTLVSAEAIYQNSSWMFLEDYTLAILGENGIATYELQPLDEENYYGTLGSWHLYEPPIVRHVD
jgi:hypothetical protein